MNELLYIVKPFALEGFLHIVTRLVTVDGYWIVNWIYCTLQPITTDYLNSTTTNSVGSILDLQLPLLAPFSMTTNQLTLLDS
jgi:hypothetical protein